MAVKDLGKQGLKVVKVKKTHHQLETCIKNKLTGRQARRCGSVARGRCGAVSVVGSKSSSVQTGSASGCFVERRGEGSGVEVGRPARARAQ